jgi:hypothetical protein
MMHVQDHFTHRLCRQLAIILAVLAIVTAVLPGLGGDSLAHAGLFDIFKPKRPPHPTPEQLQAEEANRRRDLLRTLQMQHDSENDPARKIHYDLQIIAALDPYVDFEKHRSVQNEIQQHEQEAQKRTIHYRTLFKSPLKHRKPQEWHGLRSTNALADVVPAGTH